MDWITHLPIGILYSIIILLAMVIIGVFALMFYTLIKKGKIKAGSIELDVDDKDDEHKDTV